MRRPISMMDRFSSGIDTGSKIAKLPYDLKAKQLANAIQAVKAKYAEPMSHEQLQRAILGNIQQQQENTRYGQMTPLEINKLQLNNQHQGLVNQFYPELNKSLINWRNNSGRLGGIFGKGGNAGDSEISNMIAQIGLDSGIDINTPEGYNKANKMLSAYIGGKDKLDDGTPIPAPSELLKRRLDRNYRGSTDASQRIQQTSALTLRGLFDQGTALMPSMAKYTGIDGKVKLQQDKLSSSLGNYNEDYMNYNLFTNQLVPQMIGRLLITEGLRATDQQKAMLNNLTKQDFWDSNPEMAMKIYNYLTDTFKNLIDPIVSSGPSAIKTALSNGSNVPNYNVKNNTSSNNSPKTFNEQSIKDTMDETGMTRAEVLAEAKKRGMTYVGG